MSEKIIRILGKKGRTTIPFDIRKELNIKSKDILSYEVMDENTVILRRENLCEGDTKACVYSNENLSLQNFLDSLSPEEQRKACLYLNVKWAFNEGVIPNET